MAEEVRNLAQRSAQAARETGAIIDGAIHKTGVGVTISERVSRNLVEIVDKVRRVDEFVAKVAAASEEQSRGLRQTSASISAMDQVVQSNAASAEESASAAEELNAQALTLQDSIRGLQALVGGAVAAATGPTGVSSKAWSRPKLSSVRRVAVPVAVESAT